MKNNMLKVIKLVGLGLLALGLTAIMVPRECSREEAKVLEKFQYISRQEGYQKPQKGEVTFYQTNGPVVGGSVSALFFDEDQMVYAGLFGDGVYRKKPGDDLWEPLSSGIKDPFVLSLKISKNGTLFAGTIKGGVFRSEDKGKTWMESNNGLTNFEVTIITEYRKEIFIGTGSGLFKSKDQGKIWEPLNKGMESMLVKAFLVDHTGTYFAGTGGQGIYKSVDKGKSWQHINFKLQGESGLNENYIRVIAQSSKNYLYAGTFGGGVFRSTDGGKTWFPFNTGLSNNSIRSLQVAGDGTIYTGTGDGVFISSNDGQSWKSINGDLTDKNVQSMTVTPDWIYMGTANTVFRKSSNESHWAPLERGISFPVVHSLTGDSEKGFFAGTEGGGVFRSKDGGFSWFQMNEGLTDNNIRTITEDETHTLYLLTGEGVYRGDRLKKSWVLMKEGIGQKGIYALYVDPENNLYTGTENGLFKRDNSSNYWEKIILPFDGPVKWIAGDRQKLFAVSDREVYLLKKGEANFQPITYPQHQSEIRGAYFKENLYLWTGREIFEGKSLNHDLLWRTLTELPPGVNCQTLVAENVKGKESLFAGTDKGVFWSDDHGNTWHKAAGKGALADVKSFFSPYSGTLLVGTGDKGVLVGIGL